MKLIRDTSYVTKSGKIARVTFDKEIPVQGKDKAFYKVFQGYTNDAVDLKWAEDGKEIGGTDHIIELYISEPEKEETTDA